MTSRSHLYVPANDLDRLNKAVNRGADALIIDLEDGVALAEKQKARENLQEFLTRHKSPNLEIWIRVNPEAENLHMDLEVAVHENCRGIVLAKVNSRAEVRELTELLDEFERNRGLLNKIEISALIESSIGVFNSREIAMEPRVSRLQIGEADLAAELSLSGKGAEEIKNFARSMAVFSSAVAGINPPVAPIFSDFRDLDLFRETSLRFKEMGYFGRSCIHPDQVSIANEVFMPSQSDLESARDIVQRLEQAGGGVALDSKGRMIDEAFARSARKIIEMGG